MVIGGEFVFVHNPKTGGSSVRNALLPFGHTSKQHAGLFPPRGYQSYPYRIVVVRNPYDRMVSAYEFSQRKERKESFEEWIKSPQPWMVGPFDIKRVPQSYWTWGCNYILRFENLENEFLRLTRDMGLNCHLGWHNKSERQPYQEYYTDELKSIVTDRVASDLEKFRYTFNETS